MAHWHGLAKLRMHHNLLLDYLDETTRMLGLRLCQFCQKTCTAFETRELQCKYNAHVCRGAKQAAHSNHQLETSARVMTMAHREQNTEPVLHEHSCTQENSDTATSIPLAEHQHAVENLETTSPASEIAPAATSRSPGWWGKMLNINTYKFHSYGDYARTIRTHGTMDSYLTEPVSDVQFLVMRTLENANLFQGELKHCSPKSRYTCTDRKHFVEQLTCIERRQAHIHHICTMNNSGRQTMVIGEATTAKLEEHHFIGKSQNFPINIHTFLWENQWDPAIKVKVTKC